MRFDEYQEAAYRTDGTSGVKERLTNAALGLSGEAGEVADQIKKALFHGHALDEEELAYELGDILWYVAQAANALGYGLDEIARMNIEKLRRRYPEGFSSEASINRVKGV